MYLGRFILGQFVPLPVNCTDNGRLPGAPTNSPTVKVYNSSGTRLLSSLMPPLDRFISTGLFNYRLRLGDDFAVGRFIVTFSYVLSGTTYLKVANFDVVAGGDADGAVVSLTEYLRPGASWLVQRLDSDQRVLARGPTV